MHEPWWITIPKAFIVINVVMLFFAFTTWLERKLLGRMQLRYGPNRAGPKGLLVPIADLLKLIRKEAFSPSAAKEPLYIIAPVVSMFTALLAFSVLPFGAGWTVDGYYISGQVVNVPISLILIFALGSLGIYGFIVGGWASESKYSILGSMRTCAQLVSYEVSLALSVLGVVMMGQSLNLVDIVNKQESTLWFFIPQSSVWRCSSSAAPPRRRARRSTFRRPTPSSSPATTPSTPGCAGESSRRPSTSTCSCSRGCA